MIRLFRLVGVPISWRTIWDVDVCCIVTIGVRAEERIEGGCECLVAKVSVPDIVCAVKEVRELLFLLVLSGFNLP